MRALILKTSSMGDIIHTWPALTDATRMIDNLQFDWVSEESFAELPKWHSSVNQVIPSAVRRWRKDLRKAWSQGELKQFWRQLRQTEYDVVIDAQGLIRSAIVAKLAHGKQHFGFSQTSVSETKIARHLYKPFDVDTSLHVVEKIRQLFAHSLDYDLAAAKLPTNYGLSKQFLDTLKLPNNTDPYVIFLHGTTWPNKHWPESYWSRLAQQCQQQGIKVIIPWGTLEEKRRGELIAQTGKHIDVLAQRLPFSELAKVLFNAQAVVSMDTGLGHLSAALGTPVIGLYGPSSIHLAGMVGKNQTPLQADFSCSPCLKRNCHYQGPPIIDHKTNQAVTPPCFTALNPDKVWLHLERLLLNTHTNPITRIDLETHSK